jgi:transcription initiation factor IIF auxiliary subunit
MISTLQYSFTGKKFRMTTYIPIVIGTYAKLIKPAANPQELPLFSWTAIVYLAGRPWADLGMIVERVDFTLHKSFPNVRKPFSQYLNSV